MSSIANVIKMYLLLQRNKKMKISELANVLGINERMVRRYRDELEYANIPINSERGKNGGYSLYNDNYLLGLNLSKEEMLSLFAIQDELVNNNHLMLRDYSSFMDKLLISRNIDEKETIFNLGKKNTYDTAKERMKMLDFYRLSIEKRKVCIFYMDAEGELSERVINPYQLINYNQSTYVIGFCELRNSIRLFKLSRVKSYQCLEYNFRIPEDFNLAEFFEHSFGIYKDSKFNLEVVIKYPLAQTIKERIWIEGQLIEEIEDQHAIRLTAVSEGKEEIISWLMSMGKHLLSVKPYDIQLEVEKNLKKMLENISSDDICPN